VPPPTTTDNSKLVDTQLKKPLVPNNRKNGDDLLNLTQKKNKVESEASKDTKSKKPKVEDNKE